MYDKRVPELRYLTWLYMALLAVMGLTGMGQLPIFKRYYISDVPGLGWTADFFATHVIHYVGALVLLALFAYLAVLYLGGLRRRYALSKAGWTRLVLLAGLVVTGGFRVAKNLPDVQFSPDFTMAIDVSHLGFMMVFLFSALGFAVAKKGWLVSRA